MLDGDNVQNDPVNLTDPWGLAAGDHYPTANDAARELVPEIQNKGVEYGGWIYPVDPGTWIYGGDEPYFTYTEPRTDNKKDEVSPGPRPCGAVADYHNHPRIPPYKYNQFSPSDKYWNQYFGVSGYLLTPDLGLLKYVPSSGIIRVH